MFIDLVKKTRTYRNFDKTIHFTKNELIELIELCRFTPSAANKQPLKFAYVYKQEDCDVIFPNLGWAAYLAEKPPYPGNEPTAYVLICYDTNIVNSSPDTDVGICAQTIVLGAMEKGIGACMIGSMQKEQIARIFTLPENIIPRLIIALGSPNEKVYITDANDGEIKYYRDEEKNHFVPKRSLTEILLPEIS